MIPIHEKVRQVRPERTRRRHKARRAHGRLEVVHPDSTLAQNDPPGRDILRLVVARQVDVSVEHPRCEPTPSERTDPQSADAVRTSGELEELRFKPEPFVPLKSEKPLIDTRSATPGVSIIILSSLAITTSTRCSYGASGSWTLTNT